MIKINENEKVILNLETYNKMVEENNILKNHNETLLKVNKEIVDRVSAIRDVAIDNTINNCNYLLGYHSVDRISERYKNEINAFIKKTYHDLIEFENVWKEYNRRKEDIKAAAQDEEEWKKAYDEMKAEEVNPSEEEAS